MDLVLKKVVGGVVKFQGVVERTEHETWNTKTYKYFFILSRCAYAVCLILRYDVICQTVLFMPNWYWMSEAWRGGEDIALIALPTKRQPWNRLKE